MVYKQQLEKHWFNGQLLVYYTKLFSIGHFILLVVYIF